MEAKIGPGIEPPWTELQDGKQRRRDVYFVKGDDMCAHCFTRTATVARKIWTKMKLQFLSEVIAESMWRAMGWVCDQTKDWVCKREGCQIIDVKKIGTFALRRETKHSTLHKTRIEVKKETN